MKGVSLFWNTPFKNNNIFISIYTDLWKVDVIIDEIIDIYFSYDNRPDCSVKQHKIGFLFTIFI